jgi:hypothetical protein
VLCLLLVLVLMSSFTARTLRTFRRLAATPSSRAVDSSNNVVTLTLLISWDTATSARRRSLIRRLAAALAPLFSSSATPAISLRRLPEHLGRRLTKDLPFEVSGTSAPLAVPAALRRGSPFALVFTFENSSNFPSLSSLFAARHSVLLQEGLLTSSALVSPGTSEQLPSKTVFFPRTVSLSEPFSTPSELRSSSVTFAAASTIPFESLPGLLTPTSLFATPVLNPLAHPLSAFLVPSASLFSTLISPLIYPTIFRTK